MRKLGHRWTEVGRGVSTAGVWLCIIGWISVVAFGAGMAFSDTLRSRVLGWALIAIAAPAAFLTVQRWVKMLPLVLGRMALLGFLVCQALGIAWFPSLIGFSLMLACLAIAWAVNLIRQHHRAR